MFISEALNSIIYPGSNIQVFRPQNELQKNISKENSIYILIILIINLGLEQNK